MMTKQRIAVIGAGPMGLAVAYQLARDGHIPMVFESDDRIGGMTASFDFSGIDIERYYHFHCTSDTAFLNVLDELGLTDKMNWTETKMGYWYQNRLQPWGNPFALLKFRGLGFIAKFRYGLHAFLSTKRNDWKPLDNIEATGWIRRWVGTEAYRVLWEKLFDLKFYQYSGNLSAAWIWSRIRRIGRSRYSIFREKLGYLEGGSNTLLQGMKEDIEKHGGEFRLNAPVTKINISDNQIKSIEVNGREESFDKVISTIPLPYVASLIPDLPEKIRAQFENVKNIGVACVIVKLRKAVTENFWLNTNDDEMDIPGIVEYTNLRPMSSHIVYVPYYLPGDHEKYGDADTVFFEKVRRFLRKINQELEDEDFMDMAVHKYRYAQPICDPEYLKSIPEAKLPVKGLWVADTSHYYPEDRGISEGIAFGRKLAKDALLC